MSIDTQYNLYQVEFDATRLDGIVGIGGPLATAIARQLTDGDVYPSFQAIVGQDPSFDFRSLSIAAALDQCGLTGTAISGLSAGFNLYAQKRVEGDARAGTLAHRKYGMTKGMVVPTSITVEDQGDAEIGYSVVPVYDGSNDIVAITDSITLPAVAGNSERFTIGKTTLGNILLDHIKSWTLNFNISLSVGRGDSDIWSTMVTLSNAAPSLSLRGVNIEWLKSDKIPLLGLIGTHANTAFYLRKRAQGNSFVADNVAEHIKFTGDGLITIGTPYEGSGSDVLVADLEMVFRDDGSNLPVVIDTSSAIT